MQEIEGELRNELQRVGELIEEGNLEDLPEWINPDYQPKDGNGRTFPRLTENPSDLSIRLCQRKKIRVGAVPQIQWQNDSRQLSNPVKVLSSAGTSAQGQDR